MNFYEIFPCGVAFSLGLGGKKAASWALKDWTSQFRLLLGMVLHPTHSLAYFPPCATKKKKRSPTESFEDFSPHSVGFPLDARYVTDLEFQVKCWVA